MIFMILVYPLRFSRADNIYRKPSGSEYLKIMKNNEILKIIEFFEVLVILSIFHENGKSWNTLNIIWNISC